MPNYIAFAVPFFFLLIGGEVWLARRRKTEVYRLNDSVSDLSAGIFEQIGLLFLKVGILFAYAWVFQHMRLVRLDARNPFTWLFAVLLVDLAYYFWHRLSHEVNLLWAAHVVHHSSEEYNLAVALRQGVLTPITIAPFHMPLAILGVSPVVFAAADAVSTLYQFWIHTRLVGKLGRLDEVINTPSLHRVHHAINPRYLDKNYGAILIVWDRLFGTYEREREEPVFGLVKPLRSFEPFKAQFHFVGDIAARMRGTPHLSDKLRVLVRGPEWTPPGMFPLPTPTPVTPADFVKYDPPLPAPVGLYLLAQVAVIVIFATALMFEVNSLSISKLLVGAAFVYVTLASFGGFLEGRRWALRLEFLRLICAVCVSFLLARGSAHELSVVAFTAVVALLMAAWAARATSPTVTEALSR